jgi:cytochrome c553
VIRGPRLRAGAGLLALLATLPMAATADPAVGRQKAQACTVCHGPLGISVAPDAPNLAGQPQSYISAQLHAFRGGARQHEVMSLMAKNLTNEDIRDLASWFASIKVEATPP